MHHHLIMIFKCERYTKTTSHSTTFIKFVKQVKNYLPNMVKKAQGEWTTTCVNCFRLHYWLLQLTSCGTIVCILVFLFMECKKYLAFCFFLYFKYFCHLYYLKVFCDFFWVWNQPFYLFQNSYLLGCNSYYWVKVC